MTEPTKKKTCFVLSPIGEDKSPERMTADKVLKHLVKKALAQDYEVSRADDDKNPGAISPSMIASILDANLIIADLSGFNPNVFYELAIAHGFRKPTVHIQRVGEPVPFDVKDMRVVRYDITDPDSLESAQKLLSDYAKFVEANPEKAETPLTAGAEFSAVTSSTDPVAESNVLILDAIENIRKDIQAALPPAAKAKSLRSLPDHLQPNRLNADRVSFRKLVDRIAETNRLKPEDLYGLVTPETTTAFGKWARQRLSMLTGEKDEAALDADLYDHEAFAIGEQADDGSDS